MRLKVVAARTTVKAALIAAGRLLATAESAATVALISGWALVTWGVASLTVWQAWPISSGLFLLGCFGFRLLVKVFGDGLYVLREPRDRR